MRNLRVAFVLAALVLPSCGGGGGGNPTAPSGAQGGLSAGATLTFVSGETQQPVSGATVRVGSDAYTTDGRGEIRLTRGADLGTALTVETGAFLTRETRVRDPEETTFTLWSRANTTIGLTEGYTRALIYSGSFTLSRLPLMARRVSIVLSADLLADPVIFGAYVHAAERLTAATLGQIEWAVEERYTGGIPVTVEMQTGICPLPESSACVGVGLDHGYIIDARIFIQEHVFELQTRWVALHELGHVFGLEHTPDESRFDDVMAAPPFGAWPQDFTAREQFDMRLMLQRRAGNRFPDNDAVLGLATSSLSRRLISCGPG